MEVRREVLMLLVQKEVNAFTAIDKKIKLMLLCSKR
jgi:hypothetical protein